jgi:outer membrane protein
MKKLLFILFAATLLLNTKESKAQKLGYFNSQELLVLMPEVKHMDTVLTENSDALQKKAEMMYQDYSQKLNDYNINKDKMTALIREASEKDLANQESNLQSFQEDSKARLDDLQEKMMAPIRLKVQSIVKTVATENGYTYIFDMSSGAIFYAPETDNVIGLIKKKLAL